MNLPTDFNSQVNNAVAQGLNQFNQALANSGVNLPAGTTDLLQGAVNTAVNTAANIAQTVVNNIDVNNINIDQAINTSNALKNYVNNVTNALNNPNGLNIDGITSSLNNYMALANQVLNSLGINFNTWLPQITAQIANVVTPVWFSALGDIYKSIQTQFNLNQFNTSISDLFLDLKNTNVSSQFTPVTLKVASSEATASVKDDLITGKSSADKIFGGNGDDLVDSSAGNDKIDGGNGNDKITAGAGNDVINAGDGNDIIKSGAGSDTVNGGNGDDLISGDEGNDVIKAGDGMDIIDGGAGNDKLYGGNGKDIFVFAQGNQFDTVYDFKAKTDMISFNFNIDFSDASSVKASLKIAQSGKDVKITYIPTKDVLILKNVGTLNINSFEQLVNFVGQDNLIFPSVVEEANSAQSFEQKPILDVNIDIIGINTDLENSVI